MLTKHASIKIAISLKIKFSTRGAYFKGHIANVEFGFFGTYKTGS